MNFFSCEIGEEKIKLGDEYIDLKMLEVVFTHFAAWQSCLLLPVEKTLGNYLTI